MKEVFMTKHYSFQLSSIFSFILFCYPWENIVAFSYFSHDIECWKSELNYYLFCTFPLPFLLSATIYENAVSIFLVTLFIQMISALLHISFTFFPKLSHWNRTLKTLFTIFIWPSFGAKNAKKRSNFNLKFFERWYIFF